MLHVLYCYKCNESWCDVDLFLLHFWNSLVLPGFRRRNWKSSSSTIGARAVGALGRHVENTTVAPSELFGSLSDLGASHDRSKTLQFPKLVAFHVPILQWRYQKPMPGNYRDLQLSVPSQVYFWFLCAFFSSSMLNMSNNVKRTLFWTEKTSNSHQFSFYFKDLKTFINFPSSRIKTYQDWSPSYPRWRSTPWSVNCNWTRKSWPTWRSEQCQTKKKNASRLQRTSAIRFQTCL